MSTPSNTYNRPGRLFYTLPEAARVLRVDAATIYRTFRQGDSPAVRVRTGCVVPVRAVEDLARRAVDSGGVVDVSRVSANRRDARDFHRAGGAAW